jgi:hypothetical protein
METNLDGEIGHCSGHAVACPAGMSRTSGVRVRTNIGRNSDRLVTIGLAVPAILATIDRRATPILRAAFNTKAVLGVPMTTGHGGAIGVPAVPGARVTIGLRAPTRLRGVIGTPAAQVGAVAIGHKVVVLGIKAAAIRKLGLDNLGVPANIGRSFEHLSKTVCRRCAGRLRWRGDLVGVRTRI